MLTLTQSSSLCLEFKRNSDPLYAAFKSGVMAGMKRYTPDDPEGQELKTMVPEHFSLLFANAVLSIKSLMLCGTAILTIRLKTVSQFLLHKSNETDEKGADRTASGLSKVFGMAQVANALPPGFKTQEALDYMRAKNYQGLASLIEHSLQ